MNRNGERLEQRKSGGVLCLFDFADAYGFDDASLMQHRQPVAQLQDRDEVVGYVEERCPALAIQAAKQSDDLSLGHGIEGAGGFVRDEDRRVMEKRQRDEDSLRLSDADLAGLPVQEAFVVDRQLDLFHELPQTVLEGQPCGRSMRPPGSIEVGLQRDGGVKGSHGALWNQGDGAAAHRSRSARAHGKQISSVEKYLTAHPAAAPWEQTEEGHHQGSLACAAGPGQCQGFAGAQLKLNLVENTSLSILRAQTYLHEGRVHSGRSAGRMKSMFAIGPGDSIDGWTPCNRGEIA